MTWIWASLIEGIGKLYGAKVQATVVNKVEDAEVAAMRQDSNFKQRARFVVCARFSITGNY